MLALIKAYNILLYIIFLNLKANKHVFKNKNLFFNFIPFIYYINIINNTFSLKVKRKRFVFFYLLNNKDKLIKLILINIAYILNFFCNIVSFSFFNKKRKLFS